MVSIGVLVGAITAVIAYFVPWLPDPAAEEAGPIDNVYWFVTIICIAIFALVAGVSIYSVYKFRAGPDDEEDGSPIHGHTGLEIFWTAVPAALVTAISVYSGVVLTQIEDIPKDHRVVEVVAQQFAWSFHYPDLEITSGELELPIGEPVELRLSSRDVIHSFWVPEWRLKQDAVPGTDTLVRITPNRIGSYPVICTELCGLGHSVMRTQAVVTDRKGFDEWVRKQKEAARGNGEGGGAQLFASQGCGSCHTLAEAGSTGAVGPNLDEALKGKDASFIRQSIVDPDAVIAEGYQPGVMPSDFGERLTDEQLDGLVEYLVGATSQGG
jgi:cytochrome c oxidase subunit 2